jgi:hypothetical protein
VAKESTEPYGSLVVVVDDGNTEDVEKLEGAVASPYTMTQSAYMR